MNLGRDIGCAYKGVEYVTIFYAELPIFVDEMSADSEHGSGWMYRR